MLLVEAERHERQAIELRLTASKIARPPPGVEVWISGEGAYLRVTFAGPELTAA